MSPMMSTVDRDLYSDNLDRDMSPMMSAVDRDLFGDDLCRDLSPTMITVDRDHLSDLYQDLPFLLHLIYLLSHASGGSSTGGSDAFANGIGRGYVAPRGRSRYRQAAKAVAAAVATGGTGAAGSSVWGAGRRANGVGGSNGPRQYELESCTFTPVVIGARKGMSQAQQYLQVI